MEKKGFILSISLFLSLYSYSQSCNFICNSDFDSLQITNGFILVDSTQVPCWHTTAADGIIEVWANGYWGVPAYSGVQFIELNAWLVSTLYQEFTALPGQNLVISFAHRGRWGIDTMSVSAGPVGGPYSTLGYFGDDSTAWGYYTVTYLVPNLGTNYVIRFNSIYASQNNPAIGNFLDAVVVCATNVGINEITDDNSLSLSPNPFANNLNINYTKVEPVDLVLFDATAKVMSNISVTSSVSMNLQHLARGVYFYEARNKNGIIKKGKIVKN